MENTKILRDWFERVDSEKIGSITATQLKVISLSLTLFAVLILFVVLTRLSSFFNKKWRLLDDQSALAEGNLEFPLTVVQQMIRMYDFDRNGRMSLEEFVALNKFLLKVQHAFSDLERGRGYLVPDDVYKSLVKIGFSMDSPAFYTVCESFDQKKNGRFRLDDFISLCIFVQSARNLFDSFDTAKQGRVTLDLNQFIFCTANCRI